ncbi:hypothetical protein BCAR13_560009 [Paraburkholderia caribensis]|nr:hypothetical protein BCAR13_560009 [Paraburkholderia caribensis]
MLFGLRVLAKAPRNIAKAQRFGDPSFASSHACARCAHVLADSDDSLIFLSVEVHRSVPILGSIAGHYPRSWTPGSYSFRFASSH